MNKRLELSQDEVSGGGKGRGKKGGGRDDLRDLIDKVDCNDISSRKFEDGMVGEGISPPKLR